MPNVHDFQLIPLRELMHYPDMYESYKELITQVRQIYTHDQKILLGETPRERSHIYEEPVLAKEAKFFAAKGDALNPAEFVNWANSPSGYCRKLSDKSFEMHHAVLTDADRQNVYGRSALYVRDEHGERSGSGFDLIHPTYRRQGLGHVILAHRFAQAKECGADMLKLNIDEDNKGSVARMNKLIRGGIYGFKSSEMDRLIYRAKVDFSLDRVYQILTTPQPPVEEYDFNFVPC